MPAILIDCNAKGIPIIVMQRRKADAKCTTANSQPMAKIQMILKIRLETLLEGEITQHIKTKQYFLINACYHSFKSAN